MKNKSKAKNKGKAKAKAEAESETETKSEIDSKAQDDPIWGSLGPPPVNYGNNTRLIE